jgi:hypothetical protein
VNDMTVKTGHELEQVFKRAKQSVREKAKSTGAPLYYLQDGLEMSTLPEISKFVITSR